jgi:magnesium chelatase subunit H
MRFLVLAMDGINDAALREGARLLKRDQGIDVHLDFYHAAGMHGEAVFQRLAEDAARADFIFGCMLFKEEIVRPVEQILQGLTTPTCVITSNPALIKCTRLGKFVFTRPEGAEPPGMLQKWIAKFRPKTGSSESERQTAMLRNMGKILRMIPGKARDIHTYIVVHDFWLQSSPENLRRMLCLLIERYVPGYAGKLPVQDPIQFPANGIYHPDAPQHFEKLAAYQKWRRETGLPDGSRGRVGLLTWRTGLLSGNTGPLDALIRAIEARGVEVRTAYSAGLDSRPAMRAFFTKRGDVSDVDLIVNAAGFSLVGGPASSHPVESRAALEAMDVGYLAPVPLSFQTVEDWRENDSGLSPIQVAMNIAIPELDGATEPLVYSGPVGAGEEFTAIPEQIEIAAKRVARRVRLRHHANRDKKIAIVLFNFPPNLGNIGTAAYLDVFASLHRLLRELRAQGYQVDVPADLDTLRKEIIEGNAHMFGTDGNLADRLKLEDYRRLFPYYREIESYWGTAPGELLTDGKSFYILGKQFGNVFVGIQPSFGTERDPMHLLMTKNASPHHGFAAFYTWLEHVFNADAVVHFGTHGALEFMPGKQTGLTAACWPSRLIGSLPNFYFYSVNNPSEASIAKRRGAATLVSYLVPPLQQAGLYKGLRLLKDNIELYRRRPSADLLEDIYRQADRLEINVSLNGDGGHDQDGIAADERYVAALAHELLLVEQRMIPLGLHVLGNPPGHEELVDTLSMVAAFMRIKPPQQEDSLPPLPVLLAQGLGWNYEALQQRLKFDKTAQERWHEIDAITREAIHRFCVERSRGGNGAQAADHYLHSRVKFPQGMFGDLWRRLGELQDNLSQEGEITALVHALRGGYTPASPGNDVVRNQAVVPTGRNLHGLDPLRVPTVGAMAAGRALMQEMLEQIEHSEGGLPETVSVVLWGTDNLKSDCEGVAQVFWLLGVRPVEDELGQISDVRLIPLAELGRPRIDVVVTVSGIFRDILQHQMELLNKAARLAALAAEEPEQNFVRKHTLAHAATMRLPLEAAAVRVFTNAPGSYGANVNHLVESSTWDSDSQLSEAFLSRKSFSLDASGQWHESRAIFEASLSTVDVAFQNIDSFEMGISDIDHYYEYLGGATKSVERLRGKRPPVIVADAVSRHDRLSTLEQMVRLESRTKMLNPKWYEAMLDHGYEGVREIESRVSNTFGWSATTDSVEGWVYQNVAETYVLDAEMRHRLAEANPHATAAIARRLLEANDRGFWEADEETLMQLREIYGDLEDRLEGVTGVAVMA